MTVRAGVRHIRWLVLALMGAATACAPRGEDTIVRAPEVSPAAEESVLAETVTAQGSLAVQESVARGAGDEVAAAEAAPVSGGSLSASGGVASRGTATVRILAVGDIMMGTDFPRNVLPPQLSPGDGADAILDANLIALLRSADLTIGNLEGVLFDGDGPHKQCGNPSSCFVFRSPEYFADVLADAGFDALALANNHSGDFLDGGRVSTRAALDRVGIVYAGHDEPGVRTGTMRANGMTIGLIAFAPNPGTLPITDLNRVGNLVAELDRTHDLVVVTFHGGAEGGGATVVPRTTEIFLGENRGDVYAFARRAIDNGADLVFGHGPHVPRALDLYQDRLIAYSLGNFWTYGMFNIRGLGGVGPVLDVTLNADGSLAAARIHGTLQVDVGIPRFDAGNEAASVMADLTARNFPEAGLVVAPDGTIGVAQPGT